MGVTKAPLCNCPKISQSLEAQTFPQDIPNTLDPMKGETTMPERAFNRILVATLGRPWSVHALELAVRMAKADDLELVVVAILTPSYVPEKHAAWGIAL